MGTSRALTDHWRRFLEGRFDRDFLRELQALPTRQNEYGYDPFGFHRDEALPGVYLAHLLYHHYFRAEVFGIENVPASGRVLLIANHSGQLPFDGLVISSAMIFDHRPPRVTRSMIERFVPTLPFVGYLLARWGQIVGTPENCRRLLEDDEAILVFPEGAKGISKPFSRRYQLQEFGMGFMRLALESHAPIVPVAVVGAEEQAPAFNLETVAKLIGAPAFPIMPFPPFFPALPLPSRYRVYFGEPLAFEGDPDQDDEELAPSVAQVRNTIQSMLRLGLKARKHVFW
jgi:1-acyl-sn-glycerol-3-phosphate acyltransferase